MSFPVEISLSAMAALLAFAVASASSMVLFFRTHNWRVKCLSVLIAALPVCEGARLLRETGIWFTFGSRALTDMADLAVGGLFLICVFVLKRECLGTQNAEERLCLAEAAAGWSTVGPKRDIHTPLRDRIRMGVAVGAAVAEGTESSTAMEEDERRSEIRYPSQGKAWIVVHDPDPVGELLAEVLDVSKSGIRIAVPLRLSTGTTLEADFGKTKLRGEVRWCRECEDGHRFEAGVQLQ